MSSHLAVPFYGSGAILQVHSFEDCVLSILFLDVQHSGLDFLLTSQSGFPPPARLRRRTEVRKQVQLLTAVVNSHTADGPHPDCGEVEASNQKSLVHDPIKKPGSRADESFSRGGFNFQIGGSVGMLGDLPAIRISGDRLRTAAIKRQSILFFISFLLFRYTTNIYCLDRLKSQQVNISFSMIRFCKRRYVLSNISSGAKSEK